MSLELVTEGLARIYTSKIAGARGPGSKSLGYYSKAMIFSRDLTIMVLKAIDMKGMALDGFASTGIRGIRIAKEVGMDVVLNDYSYYATELIKKNLNLNDLNLTVTKMDVNCAVKLKKFDYIDIDPYGSFVPYLTSAILGVKDNGVLGITATDLANFTGTNLNKGMRKYGAIGLRNYLKHETGIRIMLGYIARVAAEYNRGISPLLSVYRDYYYRVFVRIHKGVHNANYALSMVQSISPVSSILKDYGPLWIGNLHDPEVVKKLNIEQYFNTYTVLRRYLSYFPLENMLFFYSTEVLSKKLKILQPKVNTVILQIQELGFDATRTQFHPLGIKTHASYPIVKQAMLSSL